MSCLVSVPGRTPYRRSIKDILTEAMTPLARELMLIDPGELIALCRAEKHRHIGDLVESAAELLFSGQQLRYGGGAAVSLGWDAAPAVTLDLEFEHEDRLVLFRLQLSERPTVSEVLHLILDGAVQRQWRGAWRRPVWRRHRPYEICCPEPDPGFP